MEDFKIKVKDVKEFIKDKRMMYASCNGKRLYIALRSGPNVERYIVSDKHKSTGFTNLGDAVRLFNNP